MSGGLIPEPPLLVLPGLAKVVGLNEAIVLQQLHYWTLKTGDKDGWIYNTTSEWKRQFPFWSTDTIKRAFRSLKSKEIVEVAQRQGSDRTNSYRIDYGQIPSVQIAPMNDANCPDEEGNLPSSLIPTETTQRTPVPSGQVREVFDHWIQTIHGGAVGNYKLTRKRFDRIKARVKDGYSIAELKLAVDGCSMTPHNMGQNDREKPFNDLELICRDGEHVETFRDTALAKQKRAANSVDVNERRKQVRREQGLD